MGLGREPGGGHHHLRCQQASLFFQRRPRVTGDTVSTLLGNSETPVPFHLSPTPCLPGASDERGAGHTWGPVSQETGVQAWDYAVCGGLQRTLLEVFARHQGSRGREDTVWGEEPGRGASGHAAKHPAEAGGPLPAATGGTGLPAPHGG